MTQHPPPIAQEIRRPNPTDFSFVGFDDEMPRLIDQMQRVEIRGGTPSASSVEAYDYVPAGLSEVLRRDRTALARDQAAVGIGKPASRVDADIVYLGWRFNHYGHFLMQSLSRIWFLGEVDRSVKVIFHHPSLGRWQPAAWTHTMLAAFGVPPERILTLDEPTRIKRLIVPEPLFEPRSVADDQTVRVHGAMAAPYRALASRIAGDVTPSAQPLYLSRRRLPSSQRRIVGEARLEEILRAAGVRIAYPETMPLTDQVRLINRHSHIVSNAGSAAQSVLFALHAPRLHLLTNGRQFSPDYFMHSTVVGSPTSFINCLSTAGRPNFPRARKQTPHLLDVSRCVDALRSLGVLRDDGSARPRDRDGDLDAEYEESWVFGYLRTATNRGDLPSTVEERARALAPASWPVSLALARYYAQRDGSRTETWARQFASLVGAELDDERLAHYGKEAATIVQFIAKRSQPETARILRGIAETRFPGAADQNL